jgi:ribonuclease HI
MKNVTLYADGACIGNPGNGGYAAILECEGRNGIYRRELVGGVRNTTNNRMELRAVVEGLGALKESCMVTVYTDSMYVINAINYAKTWRQNGWKNSSGSVKNRDILEQILARLSTHSVKAVWVKGHAGNAVNERADELAKMAAENPQEEDVRGTTDDGQPDLFAAA